MEGRGIVLSTSLSKSPKPLAPNTKRAEITNGEAIVIV